MVQITSKKDIIINNVMSKKSRKYVIQGTNFLTDGSFILNLQDHNIPIYALTSTMHSKALTGTQINYDIVLSCTNGVDPGNELTVNINIPSGFTFVKAMSNEGVYSESTGKWVLTLDEQQATLNITLEATTAGSQSQTATLDGTVTTLTSTCVISTTDSEGSINSYEVLDSSDYPVLTANLQDGEEYSVIMYSRVHDAGVSGVHDGIKNNRFSLLNGTKTVYSNRATLQDTITKTTITFTYDSDYPVVITRNDQYQSVSTAGEELWYGLCINEGLNTVYSESTNLLSNPEALLDDTNYSSITLPGASESAEYVYEIGVTEIDDNQFFTGIQVNLNSFGVISSGLEIWIETEDGTISQTKSTYINTTGAITFGDMGDTWGLINEDLVDKKLYIHLKIKNTSLNEQILSYSNLLTSIYYTNDETIGYNSIIYNGDHGRIYGITLNDDTNPEGPQYDLETLSLPLTDGELPIRFNIKSKELEIDFYIHGDTLEESQRRLHAIRKWLANSRNSMSRPEYNSLIFTYDLTREYSVIFKDVIPVEKVVTSLKCTAKFTVPSGVARSTTPLIFLDVGENPGEDEVSPLIEVKTDGSSTLTITDTISGNIMTLNDAPAVNTTLYFDCGAETVTDDAGTDYTTSLTKNTIWITIMTEFNITVTGGVLQQLSFYPGY